MLRTTNKETLDTVVNNRVELLNILLDKISQEEMSIVKKLNIIAQNLNGLFTDQEFLSLNEDERTKYKKSEDNLLQEEKELEKRAKIIEESKGRLLAEIKRVSNKVTSNLENFDEKVGDLHKERDEALLLSDVVPTARYYQEAENVVEASLLPVLSVPTEIALTEAQLKAQELMAEWGIDSRTSFRDEYQKRLLSTDYFSAFKLLTARINAIPDEEDKQELEDFFYNYKEVLRIAAQKELINKYALYLSEFIKEVNLSKENNEYLVYLFPIAAMSLCFSVLVSGGALNKASILKPYINDNLNAYPNVLRDLITQNKTESLDYLLENTINTNFNNNEIMNLLMGLSSYEKIYYFFEKYNLNINGKLAVQHHNPNISAPEWNTLFARIVESKNFELFQKVMDSEKQRPALSVLIRREDKVKNYSIFYLVRNESNFIDYVEKGLRCSTITNGEINCILSLLMQNPNVLMNSVNGRIIDMIFEHESLTSVSFIEGTSHLFGFLSCADYWCQSSVAEPVIDSFKYILAKFLKRFPDTSEIPMGTSVNMYGSAVYLLAQNNDPKLFNLLLPILHHYRAWINVENPCGKTPLEFVPENNKKLRDVLFSLGAVERRTSVVSKLAFWRKKETPNVDFSPKISLDPQHYNTVKSVQNQDNMQGSNENVEQEMRDSFNRVRPKLKNVPLEIRLVCEEMFLNAESLLILTNQAERGKFNEDVFFLVQTFNDYLPSILDTYISSLDLEFIQNNSKSSHSKDDKDEVLKQISMLNNHINKLRESIELKMKKTLNMDIRKNTEFLKNKLGVREDEGSQVVQEIESFIKKSEDS